MMNRQDSKPGVKDYRGRLVRLICCQERRTAIEIRKLHSVTDMAEALISCSHKVRILRSVLEEYKQ